MENDRIEICLLLYDEQEAGIEEKQTFSSSWQFKQFKSVGIFQVDLAVELSCLENITPLETASHRQFNKDGKQNGCKLQQDLKESNFSRFSTERLPGCHWKGQIVLLPGCHQCSTTRFSHLSETVCCRHGSS